LCPIGIERQREERMAEGVAVDGVPLPPKRLLFMDRTAESGLVHGKRLIAQLGEMVPLEEGGLFLDLGCGWGRAAYGLLARGYPGSYVGFDLLPPQINWLNANFATVKPEYRFVHVSIPHGMEHQMTGSKAADIGAFVGGQVRHAAAFSIFTHVFEETILDYTRQVLDHLEPGRTLLFTAFLLNEEARSLIRQRRSQFTMAHAVNDHCFYEREEAPRNAVSYAEDWLLRQVSAQGYLIDRVMHGSWCGRDRKAHPQGQDWVLLRKPG
jgi:cyclopropane fatty-acyl-phospholipid synthase-like methyltransferase